MGHENFYLVERKRKREREAGKGTRARVDPLLLVDQIRYVIAHMIDPAT